MKERILKFLIEWHEVSDKPRPRWLEREIEKSATLKTVLEQEAEVTRSLRSRAGADPVEPSPFLAERIIANLDGESASRRKAIPWREISIGLAACLAIVAAFQWVDRGHHESGRVVAIEEIPSSDTSIGEDSGLLPRAEGLIAKADWKNPLDQEIEYVLDDAKGAIGFLAANFLPSSMLKTEQEG